MTFLYRFSDVSTMGAFYHPGKKKLAQRAINFPSLKRSTTQQVMWSFLIWESNTRINDRWNASERSRPREKRKRRHDDETRKEPRRHDDETRTEPRRSRRKRNEEKDGEWQTLKRRKTSSRSTGRSSSDKSSSRSETRDQESSRRRDRKHHPTCPLVEIIDWRTQSQPLWRSLGLLELPATAPR